MKSKKMQDPNYKYYGMTKQQILDSWEKNRKEASEATKTHYNIECYYNDMDVDDDSIEYIYFKNFRRDNTNLKPYRRMVCLSRRT